MNHEHTDFAAHRFPQRQARSVSHAYAGLHCKHEHERPFLKAARAILCLAAAAAIGAMCAGWSPL